MHPTSGEIFFYDSGNARIRKILKNGTITTVVGDGNTAWGGNGGDGQYAENSQCGPITGITMTDNGTLYWAEENFIRAYIPYYYCYNFENNDTSACSGHGVCSGPNVCSCREGWVGSECAVPTCSGISASNETVCNSRNGTCLTKNTCQCNSGWVGENCEIPICFGLTANDTRVCNGRNGTCVLNNTCICSDGYTGSDCSTPICYGILSTSENVCSSNGTCLAYNQCACKAGWTGPQCSIPICNSIIATDSSVCNYRNGSCVLANTCKCNPGWNGANCEIPTCFGKNGDDLSVCTFRNGSCVHLDVCKCNPGVVGSKCDLSFISQGITALFNASTIYVNQPVRLTVGIPSTQLPSSKIWCLIEVQLGGELKVYNLTTTTNQLTVDLKFTTTGTVTTAITLYDVSSTIKISTRITGASLSISESPRAVSTVAPKISTKVNSGEKITHGMIVGLLSLIAYIVLQ